jgi:GNAT superfamily N-acetyltransferase
MAAITFQYDVRMDTTMGFEEVYPEELQMDLGAKQQLRGVPGAIFVWMYVDGALAGESYGIPMEEFIGEMEGAELVEDGGRGGFYCYSNTVLPEFQGKGLGMVLKAHWLGLVAGKGFSVVYGHARPGASQGLNARFGARFVGDFGDWYGTGETYRMYRLDLR